MVKASYNLPVDEGYSKLHDIDPKQLRMLYQAGHTDKFVAEFFNISLSAIQTWREKFPDFDKAVTSWKDYADERVERALYDNAIGYEYVTREYVTDDGKIVQERVRKHGETAAQKLWLMNRKRDEWQGDSLLLGGKVDHAHTGSVAVEPKVKQIDLDERIAQLRDEVAGGELEALMQ